MSRRRHIGVRRGSKFSQITVFEDLEKKKNQTSWGFQTGQFFQTSAQSAKCTSSTSMIKSDIEHEEQVEMQYSAVMCGSAHIQTCSDPVNKCFIFAAL